MWKTLIGLVRDVFDLNRRVKGHDQQIERLYGADDEMSAGLYQLMERVLRLELELQHTKEQHARELAHLKEEHARERADWKERQAGERETFRLQLENLILRMQRGLPPPTDASVAPQTTVELPRKPLSPLFSVKALVTDHRSA